jgi:hypothetical protein
VAAIVLVAVLAVFRSGGSGSPGSSRAVDVKLTARVAAKNDTVTVVGADPALETPGRVVLRASSRNGIPVHYTVSAFDRSGRALPATCSPPPGALFRPGRTIVQCSVNSDGTYLNRAFEVVVIPR